MAYPTFNLVGNYKFPSIGYGTFTITDEKTLENGLDAALEAGYRHIDTAHVYENEHIIGKVLKRWFDSGKLRREDLFITTKLPSQGVHPDKVEGFIKQSLKSLQVDYVDLYLIHFPVYTTALFQIPPDEPTDHIATWKKLEEQVDLGRTRSIGVSNFNVRQVRRLVENSRIKPAANQVELHIYLQQPELVKYCQDNGIVVISWGSLGNPGINSFNEKKGRPIRNNLLDLLGDPTVKSVAQKHNKTAGQILLKFLIQKNIAVIPKSVTPSRIKENFNLFDFTLDENDLKQLTALDRGEKGRQGLFNFTKEILEHPEHPFPPQSA